MKNFRKAVDRVELYLCIVDLIRYEVWSVVRKMENKKVA